MPAYEKFFAIRLLAINQNTWTDVQGTGALPIDCNTVVIFNNTGQDIFLRTDPANANSQVTINPGQQFEIGAAFGSTGQRCRFSKSCDPVCALLSSLSGVSAVIESIL